MIDIEVLLKAHMNIFEWAERDELEDLAAEYNRLIGAEPVTPTYLGDYEIREGEYGDL